MKLVFVSGPYTNGDTAKNVKAAIDKADRLMDCQVVVFVPHLSHFQHMIHPRPYEDWMNNDLEILKGCDAVFLLPGESAGAKREVELAVELDIPVFTTMTDFLSWLEI